MAATSLSVIVPVYNEQNLAEASLRRLQFPGDSPLLSRIKVIVIDDCSTDQTAASLNRFQGSIDGNLGGGKFEWKFLRHQRSQGKGAAIRTALHYADTDLTVIHDADLDYHPHDLLKMIPLFMEEEVDEVFGSRLLTGEFRRVLHIPSDLVVDSWTSSVESRSTFDFLHVPDA